MRVRDNNGALSEDKHVLSLLGANGIDSVLRDVTGGGAEITVGLSSTGTFYYVDPNSGSDSNSGRSWTNAFATMATAFAALSSGDTVFFHGKIREQLVAPVQVFDVTIVGASTRPRHADAAPVGSESGATWQVPASPTAATPLVKVLQQGWRFVNILFAGPTDSASILLFRDGGAGDAERDASHAEIIGCRFASGKNAVESSGGSYNVAMYGNSFHDLTDYAIKYTLGAGVAASYRWQIENNRFQGCAKWIDTFAGNSWEIKNNTVVKITTPGMNTSTGTGGNVITGNAFDIAAADFDPAGGFTGHANDVWSNTLKDAIETGLPAN